MIFEKKLNLSSQRMMQKPLSLSCSACKWDECVWWLFMNAFRHTTHPRMKWDKINIINSAAN